MKGRRFIIHNPSTTIYAEDFLKARRNPRVKYELAPLEGDIFVLRVPLRRKRER